MINRIIEFSGRNKFIVFVLVGAAVAIGPERWLGRSMSATAPLRQSSPAVAISMFSRIALPWRSGENGSAGSGSVGRAGSIGFSLSYLTCQIRAVVAFVPGRGD